MKGKKIKNIAEIAAFIWRLNRFEQQMTPEYRKREEEKAKRGMDFLYFMGELKARQNRPNRPRSFIESLFGL